MIGFQKVNLAVQVVPLICDLNEGHMEVALIVTVKKEGGLAAAASP